MDHYFDKSSDEFGTPKELFDKLNFEFNFTIDAAASDENHLLPRYWTKEQNALSQSWAHERVFCNPPYSKAGGGVGDWVTYGYQQVRNDAWGRAKLEDCCQLAVFLIPAKTEQSFFTYAMRQGEVRFIQGRLKFVGGVTSARDSHCLIILRNPAYYVWPR